MCQTNYLNAEQDCRVPLRLRGGKRGLDLIGVHGELGLFKGAKMFSRLDVQFRDGVAECCGELIEWANFSK